MQTPSIKPILISVKREFNFRISLPGTGKWSRSPSRHLAVPFLWDTMDFFFLGNPYCPLMVISKAIFGGNIQSGN